VTGGLDAEILESTEFNRMHEVDDRISHFLQSLEVANVEILESTEVNQMQAVNNKLSHFLQFLEVVEIMTPGHLDP